MSWSRFMAVGLVVVVVSYKVKEMMEEPPLPHLEPDPWWGPGEPQDEDVSINRFSINISDEDLRDFKARLALPLRLTPALEGANFTYGMNSDTLQKIVKYWREKYDWREREARLNSYPHYKTRIEGLDIHFMRADSKIGSAKNVKAVPLLLIHGWPDSIVGFLDILPLLTHPQEGSNVVFDVICPSIPGFGFSQSSSKQGFSHIETSQVLVKLMQRLGYEQFYVQGGDWGARIATNMAIMYPQRILGVHVNTFYVSTPGLTFRIKMLLGAFLPAGVVVAKEDQNKLYPLSNLFSMVLMETGYMHLQATKPDTIGAALNQNPVSLAAYILEKFSIWTHRDNRHKPDGGLLHGDFPISLDNLLDNICIYWFTNSITTSVRFYSEGFNKKTYGKLDTIPVRVPAGLASFPQEILNLPKNFIAHKFYNIVTYNEQPAGGHFAAMERPALLAVDLHKFVTTLEKTT
ncbi:juvenile hormone epoxide hydrolase 1 isoform X1 [Cherax quadricarinatus]